VRAAALGMEKISDLGRRPELRLGFSNEFMSRADGWPLLRDRYGLPQTDVRGLDHDLAYRALAAGALDAIDLYTTDAEIRAYDLAVLTDDRQAFPRYDAVLLLRRDAGTAAFAALARLEGRISAAAMATMNGRVKLDRAPE